MGSAIRTRGDHRCIRVTVDEGHHWRGRGTVRASWSLETAAHYEALIWQTGNTTKPKTQVSGLPTCVC
jgi:hypothetical protein